MAAAFKKYGDSTIYHDGARGADYEALVLGARYDSGVKLGPNGEPALTLVYLNPATPQNGPLRGDLLEKVVVVHDVGYLASEDLTAIGYSDTEFSYPVPVTPTLQEQLDDAKAKIDAMQAQIDAAKPAVEPVKPVEVPAAAHVAPAVPVAPVVPAAHVVPAATPEAKPAVEPAKPAVEPKA